MLGKTRTLFSLMFSLYIVPCLATSFFTPMPKRWKYLTCSTNNILSKNQNIKQYAYHTQFLLTPVMMLTSRKKKLLKNKRVLVPIDLLTESWSILISRSNEGT